MRLNDIRRDMRFINFMDQLKKSFMTHFFKPLLVSSAIIMLIAVFDVVNFALYLIIYIIWFSVFAFLRLVLDR